MNRVLLIILITIISLFIAGLWSIRNRIIETDIKKNFQSTIGNFSFYYEQADGGRSKLNYYYYVNNKKYSRTIQCGNKFSYCKSQLLECKSKRFWVIYSTNKPNRSLIDLTHEIQGIENPPFPKTLDNFK